jgi:hypothetical protein
MEGNVGSSADTLGVAAGRADAGAVVEDAAAGTPAANAAVAEDVCTDAGGGTATAE